MKIAQKMTQKKLSDTLHYNQSLILSTGIKPINKANVTYTPRYPHYPQKLKLKIIWAYGNRTERMFCNM